MISNETIIITTTTGFPGGSDGQQSACKVKNPWVRKTPWRKKWQPTPVFLPGEFQGQRSLASYSPRGHKELDKTERLTYIPGKEELKLGGYILWHNPGFSLI